MQSFLASSTVVARLRDVTPLDPPLRFAEPSSDEAAASARLEAAREIDRLERAYEAALLRAMSADLRGDIAAAFDEADTLQQCLLKVDRAALGPELNALKIAAASRSLTGCSSSSVMGQCCHRDPSASSVQNPDRTA